MTKQKMQADGDLDGATSDPPVIFCVGSACDAFAGGLADAGFEVAKFDAGSVGALAETRTGASKGPIGIVWSSPEGVAASALLDGSDPSPELGQWCIEASEILNLFRKYRRHLLLIEADSFTDPGATDQHFVIKQRFRMPGFDLPVESPKEAAATDVEDSSDKAQENRDIQLLARMVLRHDRQLQDLLEELSASSISPVERSDNFSAGAAGVFSVLAGWNAGVKLAADLAEQLRGRDAELARTVAEHASAAASLTSERELLRQQVALQTEELARSGSECNALGAKIAEQKERVAELEEDRNSLQQLRDEISARNEELQSELGKKQLVIDEQTAQIAELEARGTEQKSEIKRLRLQITEIEGRRTEQKSEIDKLMTQVAGLEGSAAAQRAEAERQAALIESQKAQAAANASEIASLSDERELLRRQVALQTEELVRSMSGYDALCLELEEHKKRFATLEEEQSSSQRLMRDEATARQAQFEGELDKLQLLIERQKAQIGELEARGAGQKSEIENQRVQLSEQASQLGEQASKIGEQASKIGEQASKIGEQASKLAEQESKLADYAAAADALTAERDLFRKQVTMQSEQIASAKDRYEESQRELHAIDRKLKQQERALVKLEEGRALFRQTLAPDAGDDITWELLLEEVTEKKGVPFWDLIELVKLGPGVQRADGVIWTSRESARAHAIYGPYLSLEPGEYEVCFAMTMKPIGLKRPVAVVELASNVNDVILSRRTEGDKIFSNHFVMKESFTVSSENSKNGLQEFEIRLWTDQIEKSEVYLAYIRKLD